MHLTFNSIKTVQTSIKISCCNLVKKPNYIFISAFLTNYCIHLNDFENF